MLVSKFTEVEKSTKEFNVQANSGGGGKVICLNEIEKLVNFQRVTCDVKVLSVERPVEVPGGKHKQDVVIADASGTVKLTVWENEIDKMEEENCYRISGVVVREFKEKKFLSTSKQDSFIEKIEDLGDVQEDEDDQDENEIEYRVCNSDNAVKVCGSCSILLHSASYKQVDNVRVGGIEQLETYAGCIKCTAKIICDPEDPGVGECAKCGMMQSLDAARIGVVAHLMIKTASGCSSDDGYLSLHAFDKTVSDIAQTNIQQITKVSLLKASPFTIFHRDGIIRSVTRQL